MITPVISYDELVPELNGLMLSGACANALPERETAEAEIARAELFAEHTHRGLILLRRRSGLQHLRFLLTDPLSLCSYVPDRVTALELPFRRGDTRFPALAKALEDAGWCFALRRVRLSRKPGAAGSEGNSPMPLPEHVVQGAEEISLLLHSCFSPLTGCLPELYELEEDLRASRLLSFDGGVIRWRQKGRVSEIRHLAVSPQQRGKGIAKKLMAAYLALEQEKNCRVWTGQDNAPALGLYHGFGYSEDGWESIVLLWNGSRRETDRKEQADTFTELNESL